LQITPYSVAHRAVVSSRLGMTTYHSLKHFILAQRDAYDKVEYLALKAQVVPGLFIDPALKQSHSIRVCLHARLIVPSKIH